MLPRNYQTKRYECNLELAKRANQQWWSCLHRCARGAEPRQLRRQARTGCQICGLASRIRSRGSQQWSFERLTSYKQTLTAEVPSNYRLPVSRSTKRCKRAFATRLSGQTLCWSPHLQIAWCCLGREEHSDGLKSWKPILERPCLRLK